jgi:hypothetical protein
MFHRSKLLFHSLFRYNHFQALYEKKHLKSEKSPKTGTFFRKEAEKKGESGLLRRVLNPDHG